MADVLSQIPLKYEPLRNNRFIVRFPADLGLQPWYVTSSGFPAINQKEVEIPWMNTSTWVLGRYTWEKIDVTFKNLIGPSSAQAIMDWVRLESESGTGRQGYAAGYKRNFTIELLDPNEVTVQKWLIVNGFPTNVSFGTGKYDDDSISEISCSFVYDYALLVF
jgi:hypothetical protein